MVSTWVACSQGKYALIARNSDVTATVRNQLRADFGYNMFRPSDLNSKLHKFKQSPQRTTDAQPRYLSELGWRPHWSTNSVLVSCFKEAETLRCEFAAVSDLHAMLVSFAWSTKHLFE